ncbi:MAG: hypothetical protein SGBAC_004407 [Bacillariaceae sp.]
MSSSEASRSPRSDDDEDISKDLSIRSDPGQRSLIIRESNVTGVRKLRRMKRRLFLGQLASDTTMPPPNVATRSRSGPAAISPMKTDLFATDGIHEQLQAARDIMMNDGGGAISPLPSPRVQATSLRRMKRRLFLDALEGSDRDNSCSNRMLIDEDSAIHQRASPSAIDPATSMDAGNGPPHVMFSSWSYKVEHDRTLRDPPQLRARISYPPPSDANDTDTRKWPKPGKNPQGSTLDNLSSKLGLVSFNNDSMNYSHQDQKTAMGALHKRMMSDSSEASNQAIFI